MTQIAEVFRQCKFTKICSINFFLYFCKLNYLGRFLSKKLYISTKLNAKL